MVSREQVVELYRLILDREPESEAVINEKRRAESVGSLAAEMLKSDEFFNNNRDLVKSRLQGRQ
jgi:hypothetical protein